MKKKIKMTEEEINKKLNAFDPFQGFKCVEWLKNSKNINKNNFFKKGLIFYIRIPAFIVFVILISLSIIGIALSFQLEGVTSSCLLSISTGILTGIMVSIPIETFNNFHNVSSKKLEYNTRILRIYDSVRRITGFRDIKRVLIFNYAANDYAKQKGLRPPHSDQQINMLISEVTKKYENNYDNLPYARIHLKVMAFELATIIQGIDNNITTFYDAYPTCKNDELQNISFNIKQWSHEMQEVIQHFFKPSIRSFQRIIDKSRKFCNSNFLRETYIF